MEQSVGSLNIVKTAMPPCRKTWMTLPIVSTPKIGFIDPLKAIIFCRVLNRSQIFWNQVLIVLNRDHLAEITYV